MRTYTDQVARTLEKGLAPVWLIAGDEPLLTGEAADLVRARARKEGFTGRDLFVTDRSFDWSEVATASRTLSLFSERRVPSVGQDAPRPDEDAVLHKDEPDADEKGDPQLIGRRFGDNEA